MAAHDHVSPHQFWHGSPIGEVGKVAHYGIHVGTREAAKQALEARIGRPHEGEWDGTREYGKTLLDRNLRSWGPGEGGKWREHVVERPPSMPTTGATFSDDTRAPLDAVPDIFPVAITGRMTNTPLRPHEDFKANGYMAGQLKRGRAKSGYYYTNEGEDEGSISAVVPSREHLQRLDAGKPKQMRLF